MNVTMRGYMVFLLGIFFVIGCSQFNVQTVKSTDNMGSLDYLVEAETEHIEDVNGDIEGNGAAPAETNESGDISKEEGEQAQTLDAALELCEASQEFWGEGNLERAFDALDQAYALILNVDPDNIPKLIQQKENLRFMISKRILEIYASRYTVLNGNHKEIPLIMNKHVEKEIKRFQGIERRFFVESYQRSGRYRGEILKALKEAGIPEELSWLPLIESGFKVRALSRARALGLWQFIPSTGYKFGLKRDAWIDERLDPEKATAAAIAYLKELHNIFGDWSTVLAGYNCGEGAVLRVIRNQKINYLDNFWDLYQKLPRETARYVPRFLATLHILKDPAKYGITLEKLDEPIPYEAVEIEKQVQLKTVADKLGVSSKDLIALNSELRYKATPDTPYSLKVPLGEGEVLIAKLDEIPKWTPPQKSYIYHRVRRGESLYLISLKYRTSVRAITSANNIRRKHFIRPGQKLKIPVRGRGGRRRVASNYQLLPGGKYRVRTGDSLWLIARRFNTTTKEIQRLNGLKSTRLYAKQILKITEKGSTLQAKNSKSYRVQPGDNLSWIAKKHNMTLSRLLRANNLTTKSTIYPGQVIVVHN
ncbi:MAG: LysM peptidoglycan-binding domain-containing protein [Deltaproteobacteria bacterium]|nr:LysM peptidoglycan-binding domain-containing protein [Deltaproteobacteria bacterium]